MTGARDILTGAQSVIHARITRVQGSSPREEGAEMFITATAMAGTIGGGQAEWQALGRARDMLAQGDMRATLEIALGPEIGQCCGGRLRVALTRLGEHARAAHLARLETAARPHLLILGAGHVGRALARVAVTLPWRVVLVDTRADELAKAPPGVDTRLTPLPEAEIAAAPPASAYVVVTHDHGLDFLLTLAALRRKDAAYTGLIGSATKRARFARFARETDKFIDLSGLVCPIGAAGLGDKRPEVIALMTAQEIFTALHRVSPDVAVTAAQL
ncbi:xanthine dehydrogenase accessory protein XdhC [Roseinatronobacter alkalisoli]|uniref:Xanthine dehydrogenase accessory protein XdhC n=1 Tax=Roseinatronobacter alkalisoli TaxID=3028235 RepID=A0ABT5T7S5_9RHOB|nr:xanthine dehydrogenase accessory protein XdhC [Roseinatronobacter sp. HJB301]MDD7970008.1 xanthine dehydrogenase accessory protein XdhC [Roseinatronobacter sp. HJB301]